jgi:hypothetical protein
VFSQAEVNAIRASRDSLAKLAKRYNVSKSTIANVKTSRTYRDDTTCYACGQEKPPAPPPLRYKLESDVLPLDTPVAEVELGMFSDDILATAKASIELKTFIETHEFDAR